MQAQGVAWGRAERSLDDRCRGPLERLDLLNARPEDGFLERWPEPGRREGLSLVFPGN